MAPPPLRSSRWGGWLRCSRPCWCQRPRPRSNTQQLPAGRRSLSSPLLQHGCLQSLCHESCAPRGDGQNHPRRQPADSVAPSRVSHPHNPRHTSPLQFSILGQGYNVRQPAPLVLWCSRALHGAPAERCRARVWCTPYRMCSLLSDGCTIASHVSLAQHPPRLVFRARPPHTPPHPTPPPARPTSASPFPSAWPPLIPASR